MIRALIIPAVALTAWVAYVAVLRRATRRDREAVERGETRFVVCVSQRVRDQL